VFPVMCGIVFAECLNGETVSDEIPLFLNYTDTTTCANIGIAL